MTRQLMRPFRLGFPTLLPIEQLESLFDSFFGGLDANVYNPNTCTLSLRKFPKGGLYTDKEGNRVIELALAGYTKDQLSVTVENGNLTVSATKREDECECDGLAECSRCTPRTLARRAFKQIFSSLGKDFSLDKAEVLYKDGLLKIVVPQNKQEEIIKELEIK